VEVTLARSTDGARTFRNYLLSEHSYDPLDKEIGEYTALAALGGRVFGSWMEVVSQPGSSSAAAESLGTTSVIRVGTAKF